MMGLLQLKAGDISNTRILILFPYLGSMPQLFQDAVVHYFTPYHYLIYVKYISHAKKNLLQKFFWGEKFQDATISFQWFFADDATEWIENCMARWSPS